MYPPKFNLILEFYGDYWHCNPEKYNRNYFHVHKQLTSQEVWNYDRIRIREEIINHTNVNVLVIWESDWKKNKIQQISHINTLINFNNIIFHQLKIFPKFHTRKKFMILY